MDAVLSYYLPPELVDKIAREVHRKNFRSCLSQIKYCVVKIYAQGEYSFITSNNYGYYESLMDDDGDFIEVINYALNKKYGEDR